MYFYKKNNDLIVIYKNFNYIIKNFDFTRFSSYEKVIENYIKEKYKKNIKLTIRNQKQYSYFFFKGIEYLKLWNESEVVLGRQYKDVFSIDKFLDSKYINDITKFAPIIEKNHRSYKLLLETTDSKHFIVIDKNIVNAFYKMCKLLLENFYNYKNIGIGRNCEQAEQDFVLKNNMSPSVFFVDKIGKNTGVVFAR